MHVLWAASRKTKGKYLIGSTSQVSVLGKIHIVWQQRYTANPPPNKKIDIAFYFVFFLCFVKDLLTVHLEICV
jgi:hypothetical protein